MAKKERTSVTSAQCPKVLKVIINMLNETAEKPPEEPGPPGYGAEFRDLCRTFHEMAQIAALPADMREDYAKAVVGTDEEWKNFSNRAGVPDGLWRGWTDIDPRPKIWPGPYYLQSLKIDDDGRWTRKDYVLQELENIEARRLRECRVCKHIFWASRIEKKERRGGPYGCSPRCNNTIRQREFKASKKP